jgi:hypothetical protein
MLSDIGAWASIVGVIITVLGFLATLTKAQAILRRVKMRLREDSVAEARRLAEQLDECCRSDRSSELALARADGLMRILSELSGGSPLSPDLGTWRAQLLIVIEELDFSHRNGEIIKAKTRGTIRKIKSDLDQLVGRLKSKALETP